MKTFRDFVNESPLNETTDDEFLELNKGNEGKPMVISKGNVSKEYIYLGGMDYAKIDNKNVTLYLYNPRKDINEPVSFKKEYLKYLK